MIVAILWTWLALCMVVIVRNFLVGHIRIKRLDEISRAARRAIDAGDVYFMRFYDEFDKVSFDSMVWDLTRWTYRQFYPKEPQ